MIPPLVTGLTGVLPASLLVHTATPRSYQEPQQALVEFIEGEPGEQGGGELVAGLPFACVLFMPSAGGSQPNPYRSRIIREPTLLYNPTRTLARAGLVADGSAIVVGDEDELVIDAPELAAWTRGNPSRWLTAGAPQPFGPPGLVYGLQATLAMVQD